MKTIIEHYSSILDIDFKAWQASGVTCVLLDVDSTITPWLDTAVQPEIAKKLAQARADGMVHLALVTNSNRKKVARIQDIAKQCGADAYFLPERFRERKPRPSLIHRAIEQFEVMPDQVAMVGDKYSADVLAAKRANVARVAWVDRLGDADHPYDRYVRRPVEKLLKRKYRATQDSSS